MQTFFRKLHVVITDKAIRNRVLFVLGALVLFRALATIPIPGVNQARLDQFFNDNQFLDLLNIFSGGGLESISIMMLGVGPFITASIIMQLMTVMSPKIKSLQTEEGETGRAKFTQYSRLLTLPLAILQGFGFLTFLQSSGIIGGLNEVQFMTNVILIVAGSMLLMWIGELVTEFGIGNGVSIIIFAGIVAILPDQVLNLFINYTPTQLPLYLGFGLLALAAIYAVVFMTEAKRPVPITYAKQSRGGKTYGGTQSYLPLRLNQAGVIPIIFALSLLLLPQMVLNALSAFDISWIGSATIAAENFFANIPLRGAVYFALVFGFTFFYTAVTFDPEAVSKNLQRNGSFIPGIRPGTQTATYLGDVITRLTLVGAAFLGLVAVLPLALEYYTNSTTFTIGGTALLIAVVVVLDFVRRLDAQITMREY